MAPRARAAESRIFYGWPVAFSLGILSFLSGRFVALVAFLANGMGAARSLTIDVHGRPGRGQLPAAAGGR